MLIGRCRFTDSETGYCTQKTTHQKWHKEVHKNNQKREKKQFRNYDTNKKLIIRGGKAGM